MRSVNSVEGLNSLEQKLVETVREGSRHVVVVGAGDGRVARALREKLGAEAAIGVIEPRKALHRYLDDFTGYGAEPWDVSWYAQRVAEHGAIDALIFYSLQEYWVPGKGLVWKEILELVKGEGLVWVSFWNSGSVRAVTPKLPPLQGSADGLWERTRQWPQLDYLGVLGFIQMVGGSLVELWGLLDAEAMQFCQAPKATNWEIKGGIKLVLQTAADAFYWGSSVVAISFHPDGKGPGAAQPAVSGAGYNAILFQSLVDPYPETAEHDFERLRDMSDHRVYAAHPPEGVPEILAFLLSQVEKPDEIGSVLVIGTGWGRDLLAFKKLKPEWLWQGVEADGAKLEIGKEERAAAGLEVSPFSWEEPLPFQDGQFDIVITMGYFSTLHQRAAQQLAVEALRVARRGVYHLEDGRGPEQSLGLKPYSIKGVYQALGQESLAQPLMVKGEPSGLYVLKVLKS